MKIWGISEMNGGRVNRLLATIILLAPVLLVAVRYHLAPDGIEDETGMDQIVRRLFGYSGGDAKADLSKPSTDGNNKKRNKNKNKRNKFKKKPMNILLVVVDDMNAWPLKGPDAPPVKMPNFDRLVKESMLFEKAYSPSSSCMPSRTAILMGVRPSTSGIYSNGIDWYGTLKDRAQSIFQRFHKAGWTTIGTGKLFHSTGRGADGYKTEEGYEPAFDEYADPTDRTGFELKDDHTCGKNVYNQEPKFMDNSGEPCYNGIENLCDEDVDWGELGCSKSHSDHQRVSWLLDRMKDKYNNPFLMTVGLKKPHLKWYLPRSYWERFPIDEVQLPLTREDDLDDIPDFGRRLTVRNNNLHERIAGNGLWKKAVQGYMASLAFMDDQLGRLLDGLEKSRYSKDTIVVLVSDHGFHLGEKQKWRKGSLWTEGTHVPLVMKVPGLTDKGGVCSQPIDLMSVYPTLLELNGLKGKGDVEGKSIFKLLKKPTKNWDEPAIMSYEAHGLGSNNAVRWGEYRYIRYANEEEELYNIKLDPHEFENLAVQEKREAYLEIIAKLKEPIKNVQSPIYKNSE